MPSKCRRTAVILLTFLLASCVADGTVNSDRIVLSYQQITQEQATEVVQRSNELLTQIESYLGRKVEKSIQINIYDFKDDSKAHAIYYKNLVEIPVTRFKGPQLDFVLAHELGHLAAGPSFLGSSLLNEGIAVHLHSKFSEFRSTRTGNIIDVHKTANLIDSRQGLVEISTLLNDNLAFGNYTKGRDAARKRSQAYIQAGSFVKYLADTHGIKKFMHAYRDAPFDTVYGKSLVQLEADWIKYIRQY